MRGSGVGVEFAVDVGGEGGGDAGALLEVFEGGGGEAFEGAVVGEKFTFAGGADAGDVVEDGFADGALAQGAVVGDGETVGFVTEADEDFEGGGVAFEQEGGIAVVRDDFFVAFGEADGGDVDEVEFAQDFAHGAQLGDAAVGDDEVGEGDGGAVGVGAEAAGEDFGHGAGVVDALDGFDAVAFVAAAVGEAVDGGDLAGDGVGAEEGGDVVALDSAGGRGEVEEGLELEEAGLGVLRGEGGLLGGVGAAFDELVEGCEGVAQGGGFFVVLGLGGFLHRLLELVEDGGAFAAEEGAGFVEVAAVVGGGDAADAGGGAGAQDVGVAVFVGGGVGEEGAALAEVEMALDEVLDGAYDGVGGEGAVVVGAVVALDAGELDAGEFFAAFGFEGGVGCVVAQEDVVAGAVLLDEVAFEQEGGGFVADGLGVEVGNVVDEAAEFGGGFA